MQKAKQAFVTYPVFKQGFLEKYKLSDYNNASQPAIFFGVYKKTLPAILNHKAPLILIWVGTDCLQAFRQPHVYAPLFQRKDVKHIVISDVGARTLSFTPIGHKPFHYSITPFTYNEFKPVPMGNKAYYYGLGTNPAVYSRQTFDYIKPLLKDHNIAFHEVTDQRTPRSNMPGVYAQCFCNLRLTMHDGLPNSVIEMALMGRHSLWNGKAPGTHKWNCFTDIIKFIMQMKEQTEPDLLLREQTLDFINVPDKWMEI